MNIRRADAIIVIAALNPENEGSISEPIIESAMSSKSEITTPTEIRKPVLKPWSRLFWIMKKKTVPSIRLSAMPERRPSRRGWNI